MIDYDYKLFIFLNLRQLFVNFCIIFHKNSYIWQEQFSLSCSYYRLHPYIPSRTLRSSSSADLSVSQLCEFSASLSTISWHQPTTSLTFCRRAIVCCTRYAFCVITVSATRHCMTSSARQLSQSWRTPRQRGPARARLVIARSWTRL